MAVTELAISPDEFWGLSWYEWGLYLLRLKKQRDLELIKWETDWDRTRVMWATMVNIHSGKGKKVKPTDLIRLSFDQPAEKPKDFKQGSVVERFKQRTRGNGK